MFKSIKHFLKQYLNFSKKDRNGIIVLVIVILILISANVIIDSIEVKSEFDYSEFKKALAEWDENSLINETVDQFLFNFNPNTITEQKLDSLLLPDFVKRNLVNYRKAGGKIKTSADFRKIYGMNDSIFLVVEKYIIIRNKEKVEVENVFVTKPPKLTQTEISNSHENIQSENQSKPLIVELNSADSSELVELKGIGPVFASRIIKYRSLLGGFYSPKQLLEVYNFPEETFFEIQNNITTDTLKVEPIRINFAEYKDLLRHPYFNKENVESIINFREKNGPIKNEEEIYTKTTIDSITFCRIKPYISYR